MVFDKDFKALYRSGMNRLRKLRDAKGLTQGELAKLAGTSQPQINRLEADSRELTAKWAERLAPHLGVIPEEVIWDPRRRIETEPEILAFLARIDGLSKTDIDIAFAVILNAIKVNRGELAPDDSGDQSPAANPRREKVPLR